MYNNYCIIVLETPRMKAELLKMNLLMYFILTSLGSSEICVLCMFLCLKEFFCEKLECYLLSFNTIMS